MICKSEYIADLHYKAIASLTDIIVTSSMHQGRIIESVDQLSGMMYWKKFGRRLYIS